MSHAGFDGVFKVDDSGGTLRDISAHLREVTLSYEGTALDRTTFGQLAMRRLGGLKDWSISVSGFLDVTALTGSHTVLSGIVNEVGTIEFGPIGLDSGDPKFAGEALCVSYEIGDAVDGIVTIDAEFEADGDGTFSTV